MDLLTVPPNGSRFNSGALIYFAILCVSAAFIRMRVSKAQSHAKSGKTQNKPQSGALPNQRTTCAVKLASLYTGRLIGESMNSNRFRVALVLILLLVSAIICIASRNEAAQNTWQPLVPKTWDERALQALELPLASRVASPKYVSADYYYRIPIRPIYKSYPIYHPDKEPSGYYESL